VYTRDKTSIWLDYLLFLKFINLLILMLNDCSLFGAAESYDSRI